MQADDQTDHNASASAGNDVAADSIDVAATRRRSHLRLLPRVAALGLVAALLVLLVWQVASSRRGSDLVGSIKQDRRPPAPAFRLPVIWTEAGTWPPKMRRTLSDGSLAPVELRGYTVVLNFWASWCGPCKEEAPRFAASARAHAGKVIFLGVDVQDFVADAHRFLRRFSVNYPSVRDGGGSTWAAYGLTGVPETYYLDTRGRIVAHDTGAVSRDELERSIELTKRSTG